MPINETVFPGHAPPPPALENRLDRPIRRTKSFDTSDQRRADRSGHFRGYYPGIFGYIRLTTLPAF